MPATEQQPQVVVPVETAYELQLALLADMRPLGGQVLEHTPAVSLAFVDRDVPAFVQRLIARRELLERVGWPGRRPSRESVALPAGVRSELALELLTAHRDREHERLVRHVVPADERVALVRRVETLHRFLISHCQETPPTTPIPRAESG